MFKKYFCQDLLFRDIETFRPVFSVLLNFSPNLLFGAFVSLFICTIWHTGDFAFSEKETRGQGWSYFGNERDNALWMNIFDMICGTIWTHGLEASTVLGDC